jgi:hypothetical protein
MKDIIAIILTNPAARSNAEVEALLINQARVAAPWAD